MKVVVTLSEQFQKGHPRCTEATGFAQSVFRGQEMAAYINSSDGAITPDYVDYGIEPYKIHTCRANYPYWKKKIDRLKEVGGVLSLRYWAGVPYRSGQNVIVDIPAENVGIEKLTLKLDVSGKKFAIMYPYVEAARIELSDISRNDGLSISDYFAWFYPDLVKANNYTDDFAIIHFTKFRYGKEKD